MSETIFAPITAINKSGICVVRISGSEVRNILQKIGLNKKLEPNKTYFHKIRDPKNSNIIDESLITFFASPNSFTGEDVAEISIHASNYILKKLSEIFLNLKNIRYATAGEFSKRAFLNGKIDLVQAEAIPDLIAAETEFQHKQALKQLDGNLGKIYEDWRIKLIEISANIEAAIDFPDEDLPQNIIDKVESEVSDLALEIKNHLNDNKIGQKIKEGLEIVIFGAPNAGKSSLLNYLSKSDVAIVSDIEGTTRDIIEVNLDIAGFAVKIIDTAGIRNTNNEIEKEGVKRALKKIDNCDIKIFIFDSSNPDFSEFFKKLDFKVFDQNSIILKNKIDLLENKKTDKFNEFFKKNIKDFDEKSILEISIKKNINLDQIFDLIKNKIEKNIPSTYQPFITNERYRVALKNIILDLENFSLKKEIELASEDLRFAAREIGKINGKVDIENILDVIFSNFCIGK